MIQTLVPMTWTMLVNSVAHDYGLYFTDEQATGILWEYTGFPGFWQTKTPWREAELQLRELFGHR